MVSKNLDFEQLEHLGFGIKDLPFSHKKNKDKRIDYIHDPKLINSIALLCNPEFGAQIQEFSCDGHYIARSALSFALNNFQRESLSIL